MSQTNPTSKLSWLFVLLLVAFIAACVYGYLQIKALGERTDKLARNVVTLSGVFASTTAALQATIDQTHSSLSIALNAQQQNVVAVQQQLGGVQNQVGSLSGTVGTIQKLSQIDPQLLQKYSKVFFLNDNYVPAHLSEIPLKYQYSENKQLLFQSQALPHLLSMLDAAASANVTIYVQSAYRSFAEQKALKGQYTVTYGAGTANSFAADQGYSEHQLGTTLDVIAPGLHGELDESFEPTAANKWMVANAHRFGFILSYPKNNGYYVYEPWHWRYVGIKLATDLHNQGKNFYDLDQRTIDTYLISLFD